MGKAPDATGLGALGAGAGARRAAAMPLLLRRLWSAIVPTPGERHPVGGPGRTVRSASGCIGELGSAELNERAGVGVAE